MFSIFVSTESTFHTYDPNLYENKPHNLYLRIKIQFQLTQ
jgi:hypothetical protein